MANERKQHMTSIDCCHRDTTYDMVLIETTIPTKFGLACESIKGPMLDVGWHWQQSITIPTYVSFYCKVNPFTDLDGFAFEQIPRLL